MAYSESDTRSKLIDPKIKSSDWLESNIVREYYFTDGRKLIGGKRGKRYFVDYLLTYKNTNLAIIEAKAESKDPLDGLQQSINYVERLRIDFVYSTNGHKIYEHSLKERKGSFVENYPTPDELFVRKYGKVTPKAQDVITCPFHIEDSAFVEKFHNEKAKEFIEFILERYKKDGVKELDEDMLGKLVDLSGLEDVKSILQLARDNTYKSVNFIMVEAYWNIGKKIVQEEQNGNDRAEYGTYLIKELSAKLTTEFGKGFSVQSLWNMRQFYNAFPILSTLWRELSWRHYVR